MTTSYRSLTILFVSVLALVGYNFMSAAWTDAPANPPSNNVAAPINVSSTTQTKTGRLELQWNSWSTSTGKVMFRTNGNSVGNIFAAGAQMWSPEYCDGVGENCSSATDIFNVVNNFSTTTGLQLGSSGFPPGNASRFIDAGCTWVNGVHVSKSLRRDISISRNGQLAILFTVSADVIRKECAGGNTTKSCTISYNGSDWQFESRYDGTPDNDECGGGTDGYGGTQ